MDSTSIGMLISALATIRTGNGEMRIASVGSKINNLLNIVQIERIMKSYDSVDEAIKSF